MELKGMEDLVGLLEHMQGQVAQQRQSTEQGYATLIGAMQHLASAIEGLTEVLARERQRHE